MSNSIELRTKLKGIKDEMTNLNGAAEAEDRGFTSDETAKWDKMTTDAQNMNARISRAETIEAGEKEKLVRGEHLQDVEERSTSAEKRGDGPTYDKTFSKYIRSGKASLSREERSVLQKGYVDGKGEKRTQITTTNSLGGYLVNETYGSRIIEQMTSHNGFMNEGTIFRTASGATLNMPSVDETGETGERLGEAGTAAKNNFAVGTFTMGAHKYGSGIMELSNELVQDDGYNVEAKLGGWAATRIARLTASDMTIGHAGGTHIGSSSNGLTQSVTASGEEIAIDTFAYDNLVDLIKSVDRAYAAKNVAKFCLSSRTEGLLMKMKDSQNRPLWIPSTREGAPDKILGYEYFINDFMPEASTNDFIPMLFGDFTKYLIRISKDISLRRSEEYGWERDAVAYYALVRIDAKLEDAGAIKSLAIVSA